jgi:tetratricopeptide (TPR) repeat protein
MPGVSDGSGSGTSSGSGPGPLSGQTVVFTGRLRSLSRREAAGLVESAGGSVRSRVTRETRYLVAGQPQEILRRRSLENRKQRLAERLNSSGAEIRVVDEREFLRVLGIEMAAEMAERYYSAAELRTLYDLPPRVLHQLERMRVLRPVLRTYADRYYTFADLLVLRQVAEALARGVSLTRIARRLRLERRGQLELRFGHGPAEVLEFRHPMEEGWTAEDWYAIGCQHDEDPTEIRRAVKAYERALELDPHHVGALVNLGNIEYQLGQVEEARRLYELALAIDPQNPNVHYNLGNVFDDLEEYTTAIRFFESALRLRPENADAHFNLGLVYDRIGRVERVREHMQAYLRYDPNGEMADVATEYLSLTTAEDEARA